jgi:hypothetical protein
MCRRQGRKGKMGTGKMAEEEKANNGQISRQARNREEQNKKGRGMEEGLSMLEHHISTCLYATSTLLTCILTYLIHL